MKALVPAVYGAGGRMGFVRVRRMVPNLSPPWVTMKASAFESGELS